MRWNLRLTAAEQGIWKSTEMRRRLAEAGLEISAGKMSALWTGTPTSIRLDDLDVICSVLGCSPTQLLITEPEQVASRAKPHGTSMGDVAVGSSAGPDAIVAPRLGRNRSTPPA